jgi:uncharacterized protein YggE
MARNSSLLAAVFLTVLLAKSSRMFAEDELRTETVTGHSSTRFRRADEMRARLVVRATGNDAAQALTNLAIERGALAEALNRHAADIFSDPVVARSRDVVSASQPSIGALPPVCIECTLEDTVNLPSDLSDTEQLGATGVTEDRQEHMKLADKALQDSIEAETKIRQNIANARTRASSRIIALDKTRSSDSTAGNSIGEPRFLYVRYLNNGEPDKLLKNAVADAEVMATQLAGAADAVILKMVSITTSNTATVDPYRNVYLKAKMGDAQASIRPSTDCWVVFSEDRNNLVYSVSVTVEYEIRSN